MVCSGWLRLRDLDRLEERGVHRPCSGASELHRVGEHRGSPRQWCASFPRPTTGSIPLMDALSTFLDTKLADLMLALARQRGILNEMQREAAALASPASFLVRVGEAMVTVRSQERMVFEIQNRVAELHPRDK
jgi:hypothetical protein